MTDASPPLGDDEVAMFNELTTGSRDDLALVRAEFAGKPVAVVAMTTAFPGDAVGVYPVAILVSEELFDLLTPPADAEVISAG